MSAVPATLVHTGVLPAPCVQTKLLPEIFVWKKELLTALVQSNGCMPLGGEPGVVPATFVQTGELRATFAAKLLTATFG